MKSRMAKLGVIAGVVMAVFALAVSAVLAVTITFDGGTPSDIANGGSLASTPGTVPIGPSATYVSGGAPLTGIATCWPSGAACDPGGSAVTPAAAASAIDHYWLQYDPPIVFSVPSPQWQIVAVPGIDHGPLPGESLEFIVWGSSDGTALTEEGAITAVYDDGVDGTVGAVITGPGAPHVGVGLSDDFTSVWTFNNRYSFFIVTSGDHIAGFSSPGEGEIDGLAMVVYDVGGTTSFLAEGSGSSTGIIIGFAATAAIVVALVASGAWYTRRRWLGSRS